MKCKLYIVEPWESTNEKAIEANIIKETENQFLLFLEIPIKFRSYDAQWFICEIRNKVDKTDFKNRVKRTYPINMVYDNNLNNSNTELPDIESYRGNFLSGEVII